MSVATRTNITAEPPLLESARQVTYLRWAAIFMLLGVLAVFLDEPVSRIFLEKSASGRQAIPGDLRRFIALNEFFGHGTTAGLIVLTVYVLDRERRRQVPWLLAFTYGAGIIADILKFSIGRTRPLRFDLKAPIMKSFVGYFPSLMPDSENIPRGWEVHSFPSGHTAVAVGLALGLSRMYPHGRWLFATFATLAALQRIDAAAHWLSDTLIGAGIAMLWVGIVEWLAGRRGIQFEHPRTPPSRFNA